MFEAERAGSEPKWGPRHRVLSSAIHLTRTVLGLALHALLPHLLESPEADMYWRVIGALFPLDSHRVEVSPCQCDQTQAIIEEWLVERR